MKKLLWPTLGLMALIALAAPALSQNEPFKTFLTGLIAAGTLGGSETIPCLQAGVTKGCTPSQLATYIGTPPTAANPTATAGPAAVNGSAATFMRSDAAPAVQKATSSQFGIVEVDGTTITASAGVISSVGGATGANGDILCYESGVPTACQTGHVVYTGTGVTTALQINASNGQGAFIGNNAGPVISFGNWSDWLGGANFAAIWPALGGSQHTDFLLNNGAGGASGADHSDIVIRNLFTQTTQASPGLSSCGTGSPAILSGSTDTAGQVTEGTTTTGCIVTMTRTNYGQAPSCVVSFQSISAITPPGYAIGFSTGTVTITVTNISGSGLKFNYHCDYFT